MLIASVLKPLFMFVLFVYTVIAWSRMTHTRMLFVHTTSFDFKLPKTVCDKLMAIR